MTILQSRKRLQQAEEAYNHASTGRDLTVAREELTEARRVYSEACVRLVESLPELLVPFHLEATSWHPNTAANDAIYTIRDEDDLGDGSGAMQVGDLRAISRVYKELTDE